MSSLAYVTDGQVVDPNPDARKARDRIRQGREHRRQFEPIWQLNAAYAAGQHWLVADRITRTLRRIQDVDPKYADADLYAFDVINEYRTHALGELASDDDRPELLLQREDESSEDFQAQLNRALGHGWDHEWRGEDALAEADRMTVDLGTSAIQVYFDPTQGPQRASQVPHYQGMPVFGDQARTLLGNGPNPAVEMRDVQEGRICWRPLSPFNLIVPPGVVHEKYFPWECTVIPTPLDEVKDRYGQPAAELKEDADIGSILGMEAQTQSNASPSGFVIGESRRTRLRDHVWLFTYYERPTGKHPQGRTLVFAGNQMKLVSVDEKLPYCAPDGTYRSGLTYMHWWRVTGRFWSRSLVSSLQDIQRAMNKREVQKSQIIDRGLPFIVVEEGSGLDERIGLPVEVLSVKAQTSPPQVSQGIGPGEYFYRDIEAMRESLEHASGIRSAAMGENPSGVNTYAQLNLMFEADQTKRLPMMRERRDAITRLVEDSVFDIRTYWGDRKQIMLAGDDQRAQAEQFNATRIPTWFIVHEAKGAAKPRSQAAELTKVEQLYNAAVEAGLVQANPQAWIDWYKESLDSGEALPLPHMEADDQTKKAQLENHMLLQGEMMPPDYFDPIEVHLPIHRSAQIQARMAGDQLAWNTIEQHVRLHEQMAMQAQAEVQDALPQPAQPPVDPQQQMQAQVAQQGEQRAQDMHQQQVRKAAADADLAEKRASQTDFTPKPSGKGK